MLDHSPRPLVASFPQPSDYPEYDELRELMAEDRRRRALDAAGQTITLNNPSDALALLEEPAAPVGEMAEGLPIYRHRLLLTLCEPTTGSHKRRRALAKRHRLWCRDVARWAASNLPGTTRKPVIKKGLTR